MGTKTNKSLYLGFLALVRYHSVMTNLLGKAIAEFLPNDDAPFRERDEHLETAEYTGLRHDDPRMIAEVRQSLGLDPEIQRRSVFSRFIGFVLGRS